jgi:maltose phosphorylase
MMDANWEEKFWEPLDVKHTEKGKAFVTARTFKTHFHSYNFYAKQYFIQW